MPEQDPSPDGSELCFCPTTGGLSDKNARSARRAREGLRKVDYQKGDVKQQVSSTVRSCLRHYRCTSFGEWRTLLEAFNVSAEERTGSIDGRDYAGMIYGALTDDGYGIGTPFKSSRIGEEQQQQIRKKTKRPMNRG